MAKEIQSIRKTLLIIVLLAAGLTPVIFGLDQYFKNNEIPSGVAQLLFDLPLMVLGYSGYILKRTKKYNNVILSVFVFTLFLSIYLQHLLIQNMAKDLKSLLLFFLEILFFTFVGGIAAKLRAKY